MKKYLDYQSLVKFAGLTIDWAAVIMVMENKHRQRIVEEFARLVEHTPIHVLDIPDDYKYMDPELMDVLEQTVEPLLFA